jgi:hypothetical protein
MEAEEKLQSAAEIVATAVAQGSVTFAFVPVEPSERLNRL